MLARVRSVGRPDDDVDAPYLTAIVRHQVQLHVSPPLHTDVAAQRRLNVLWVRRQDEGIDRPSHARPGIGASEVAERDAVIHALERRLAKEREAFKAAVAANTEQTRQLHAILIKAQKGKFVDAATAHSLEDLQKRNTHLLHINRVLRSHVSLAGMTAGELNLADLELDQETFVALQRIQAEAAGSSDPHAVPAALARAAHQVAHGKLHKRIRPGGEDSDNDLGVDPDSSSEDKPPIPTDQASSAMSAAGLGDDATAESSSPKPGRRGLHKPKVGSKRSVGRLVQGPSHLFVPDQVKVRVAQVLARSRPRSPSPTTSSTGRPRPSGVTSPYRSSSDEDDSADDEGPRDPSIAKRPSLPASPSSTPMEVDDNGGRTRKDAGGDSRRDEPSFDFSSGDTAGEEAVPAPTEGSSSAGGAGDASSSARSDVPGGEGSPADTGRPGQTKGRHRYLVLLHLSEEHIAANFSSTSIAASRVSSFPPWVQPYLDMPFTAPGAKSCFERVLSRVLPDPTPGDVVIRVTIESLRAFFDYEDPNHPWQIMRQLLPEEPCLFDIAGFDPKAHVSKRAPRSRASPFVHSPELIVEPSVPSYPVEPLPLVPKTTDWLAEAAALERRQPWRAAWVFAPFDHPTTPRMFLAIMARQSSVHALQTPFYRPSHYG
ncbi:hypothetical protein GQ600_10116 [Phytophthora cactorum]|nr:hypothetical protein GQ600_10116 [Phytophthora cactorum]